VRVGAVDVAATVRAIALGRIGLGVGYTLLPGAALKAWPGRAPSTPGDGALLRMMARSTGGRDISLGLGVLLAQKHNAPLRGWLEAAVLADAADAVAVLVAFRHLPRARAVMMLGAAVGTAVAGHKLARAVG
jgi:hypothetical protein